MPSNNPMVNEVSICNQALLWLGQDTIRSFQDNNTTAEWMRGNYPFLRDALLESRMWTFVTARHTSTVQDKSEWGDLFVHPIPGDWMQVFRVYSNVSSSIPPGWMKSAGWVVEGINVLARDATVYMWGIEREEDTGRFSSLFNQALAARIAADAAIPLTGNRNLQQDMWNLYSLKLSEAATRDGQQGSNELIQSNSLINARYRGGR